MEHYKFTIEGKQFKPSYIIYIIRVSSVDGGNYFYVGQTGDRKHITARPPFRRLAGHLDEINKSTQNQLYKGILEKILNIHVPKEEKYTKEIKRKVSGFLEESGIEMFVVSVKEFPKDIKEKEHKENVRHVEDIEKNVIKKFVEKFGSKCLLNKKYHEPSGNSDSSNVADAIFTQYVEGLSTRI